MSSPMHAFENFRTNEYRNVAFKNIFRSKRKNIFPSWAKCLCDGNVTMRFLEVRIDKPPSNFETRKRVQIGHRVSNLKAVRCRGIKLSASHCLHKKVNRAN